MTTLRSTNGGRLPESSSPQASARLKRRLQHTYSIESLRRVARKRLPRAIFDFYDGGAEDEIALRENSAAFERLGIVPRFLVDVATPSIGINVLGEASSMPLVVAPTGAIGYGWPFGDVAIARAAGAVGVPYVLPTSATSSIERVAREAPHTRLWFQSYMLRKHEFTMGLIERARQADYEALVITIDMPTGGKRERDIRNDFGLPFQYTLRNVMDFASRPAWALQMLNHGRPTLENMIGFVPDETDTSTIASSVGKNYDPSFSWDRLAHIRDVWPRRLVIKGIMHPDDARMAVRIGCDALVVSNHGGRQLDCSSSSLQALPAIAQAVGSDVDVLIDGGIRRGSDVVKAIALGAKAVMVGRPMLYGVSAGGQDGAERALFLLQEELTRTMRLSGLASIDQVAASILKERNESILATMRS